jgi:3-methyladenine DNA glycosylase AlkD
MKPSPDAIQLVSRIRSRLAELPLANTSSVRNLRRDFSRQLKARTPAIVMETALLLLEENSGTLRFFAYELVCNHKQSFESLSVADLLQLGTGINSWESVDGFGMILSGPSWREGRIPDETIRSWAASDNLWWRRAALVSTVALSRRGLAQDVRIVTEICTHLATDREDMVVKALSWALRELSKKHPKPVREFIAQHRSTLAARVVREVENKLRTGLKTPRK